MFKLKIQVDKIEVMLTDGTDRISIYTENYKPPFPYMKGQNCVLSFECTHDYGIQYVEENFGYTPNIINIRTTKI